MRILLLFTDPEVLDTVAFFLEANPDNEVLRANSTEAALKTLSAEQGEISALVMDENAAAISALGAALGQAKGDAPAVILCRQGQTDTQTDGAGLSIFGVADYDQMRSDLDYFLQQLGGKNAAGQAPQREGDDHLYSRIRTNLLIRVSPLDAGVFIRLSPTHYVQLFAKGDHFSGADLERYQKQKDVQYMYLRNGDTRAFLHKLNDQLKEMLGAKKLNRRDTENTIYDAMNVAHELIRQIGVTEEVQELVKNNVSMAMKVMGDYPKLGGVLERLYSDPGRYISTHSMSVAHVACALATCLNWVSDMTFEKLTIAAFMHDVTLAEDDLAAVRSLDELDKKAKQFTPKQIQDYRLHPKRGSLIVGQFKEMAPDVAQIILQHHEHPRGTGFPSQLKGPNITPLAALFIVAHDLVDYAADNDGKVDMEEFLIANEQKYNSGNFKKILKGAVRATL